MLRRRLTTDRLILILGLVVLILGALILWLASRNAFLPEPPTAEARARTQVHDILGREARVSYTETGRRKAICGYVEHAGETIAFVSQPSRLMLATDPLKKEFDQMQADFCPGFLARPAAPRPVGAGS
jgi:hypothetical protein